MEYNYDLIVIGSGPGGYVSAIKASKLGMRVIIIEGDEIGGTCLNRGCIPTKSLLHSSNLYHMSKNIEEFGVYVNDVSFDLAKIMERKDKVVSTTREGIITLLKANNVNITKGFATIINNNTVIVNKNESITGKNILIATGAKSFIPNIKGHELEDVVTSDLLLSKNDKLYEHLLIIGGGVIGVEFATIYKELGSEVTIIEAMDRILPTMDREISTTISMSLKKKGVTILPRAKVCEIKKDDTLHCVYEIGERKERIVANGILIATGRKANTEGLFGESFHLNMDGNFIKVDSNFQTSVKGIYAIGDVTCGKQLAHVATAQGIVAVEHMCNKISTINLELVPSCIYTNPEVAVVGLSKEEAKDMGIEVKVGKYPLHGNCKTMISGDERGYIKVILDVGTNRIIGSEIVCARATDMIGELALAITSGMKGEDIGRIIRAHPTYYEGITEAIEDISGSAIHMIPKRI